MLCFDYSLPGLGFPRRPSWNYDMTRESLLRKEEKSYRDYLEDLHSRNPPGSLSHFEHNLEVTRHRVSLIKICFLNENVRAQVWQLSFFFIILWKSLTFTVINYIFTHRHTCWVVFHHYINDTTVQTCGPGTFPLCCCVKQLRMLGLLNIHWLRSSSFSLTHCFEILSQGEVKYHLNIHSCEFKSSLSHPVTKNFKTVEKLCFLTIFLHFHKRHSCLYFDLVNSLISCITSLAFSVGVHFLLSA